jgi:hypothetical protein
MHRILANTKSSPELEEELAWSELWLPKNRSRQLLARVTGTSWWTRPSIKPVA